MKDKIRLIYNKIENRIDEICDDGFVLKENQQEYETLTDLEDFIDSFPKEPANEDLEEEIERCWKEMFPIGWSDYTLLTLTYEQHKAFANHFAEWQKLQMMKDAVEGEVIYQIGSSIIAPTDIKYKVMSDRVYISNVKLGDKVKIIIVKEDQ